MRRSSVARSLAPLDRLVGARLQQVCKPNPEIVEADLGIAGTEPNGSFLGRNSFVDGSDHELAPSEMRMCVGPVAVERDDGLIFGYGLIVAVLRPQHLAFGEMCERAAWRCGQGPLGQLFRACDIG